ncbi:MAG: hypothetical protein HQL14_08270 [Candidatus Omnitrophica bacterium]|nr:hypothetical protein [Candidatus Omnitrophota bacterium]
MKRPFKSWLSMILALLFIIVFLIYLASCFGAVVLFFSGVAYIFSRRYVYIPVLIIIMVFMLFRMINTYLRSKKIED